MKCKNGMLATGMLAAACLFCQCRWQEGSTMPQENDPTIEQATNSGALRLQLHSANLEGGLTPGFEADSVVVSATGEGFPAQRHAFSEGQGQVMLQGLPAGARCRLEVMAYGGGRLLYQAQVETVIDALRKQPVDVVLRPCFGRVRAQVLLTALESGVTDGRMVLTAGTQTYTAQWSRKGALGAWVADTLPEGEGYAIEVELFDAAGQAMYRAQQTGIKVLAGTESKVEITLLPTQVKPALKLTLSPVAATDVVLRVPSRLRAPGVSGELQITELYPIPSAADSGSEGEWLEIMNATGDSLSLAGCRISRELSTTDTRNLRLDSVGILAPGAAVTLGRSASGAQYRVGAFSLVNTSTTLWLTCQGDSSIQDTVRYEGSGTSENAVILREGQVAQRHPSSLGAIARPDDFCIQPARAANGQLLASPGQGLQGCGEN